jgi:tellurite methyltransferase
MNGGYDEGYKLCPCFWGREPGSLLAILAEHVRKFEGLDVLDLGCGEGKNAAYLAARGARVCAVDISGFALRNARNTWGDADGINWQEGDVRVMAVPADAYDIIIAYGLFHCLSSPREISALMKRLKIATRPGGYHLVCAFNSRFQDLSAHPGFQPCLMDHAEYVSIYEGWTLLHVSDSNLTEVHPHNGISHAHALTRLIAQRP